MRPHQIFAAMEPARAERFFSGLAEGSPAMFTQMIAAAAASMKSRPAYVQKLPPEKKASAMRRALARVSAAVLAEEVLAVYFLKCRKELLTEWLDGLGIAHDEGSLEEAAPTQPDEAKLRGWVETFRKSGEPDGRDGGDRELLLRAFAGQDAIDWPILDALLGDA